MLVGVMGLLVADPLQRLNAFKNALAAVNVVAGVIYAFVAPVSWPVVAVLAVSSTVGGLLGATVGKRLSPRRVARGDRRHRGGRRRAPADRVTPGPTRSTITS